MIIIAREPPRVEVAKIRAELVPTPLAEVLSMPIKTGPVKANRPMVGIIKTMEKTMAPKTLGSAINASSKAG